MLWHMRALYLGLAAAFSVAALALKLFGVSNLATVACLLVAGIFLVLGLKVTADRRARRQIELDDDKRATVRAMLDRGDEGAAVRQMQLWFRDASPEEARRAVLDLR